MKKGVCVKHAPTDNGGMTLKGVSDWKHATERSKHKECVIAAKLAEQ